MVTYTQDTADSAGYAGDGSVSDSRLLLGGVTAADVNSAGDATVSDTIRTLTGETAPDVHAVGGAVLSDTRKLLDATTAQTTRFGPEGVIIPTGEFRDVIVYVEDSQGEPLTSATWVQSAGLFPTAARVEQTDDGRAVARLWLLNASYQEFQVLAEGTENVGYVWYQTDSDADTPAIDESDREVTLRFNESEPASGTNNLSVGFGASIGGI